MENIKQHSTDDCNLAKPLQGYLTRHIKQGDCFLESKTMTTSLRLWYFEKQPASCQWLRMGSVSMLLMFAFVIFNSHSWGVSKGQLWEERHQRWGRRKVWDSHSWSQCYLRLVQPFSTTDAPWTRHPEPASVFMSARRQKIKITFLGNFACI